ncbi:hypothetical protein DBL07_25890 [Achromobacter mucicolens]|nr:hypothetical protein DBL07_25890 [Achromobacter mucicolens]
MALIRCSECKKRFSSLAAACPSCGAPVATAILADKQDQKHKKIGLLIVAAVIVVFAATSKDQPRTETANAPTSAPALTAGAEPARQDAARSQGQPAVDENAVPNENSKYLSQLDREIASIPGIKTAKYADSLESIKAAVLIIGAWGLMYEQGESMRLDTAAQRKRQQFRSMVSKKQSEMLPAIRNAYGPLMRKQLWEANGSARTIGPGYRTVEFVSAAFANNANIKKINEQMHDMLVMLRFTRAQYKWFAQAEDYTYYTLDVPKDSDVVKWENNGRFKVLP